MERYSNYKKISLPYLDSIPETWSFNKLGRVGYMKGRIGWQGLKQSEFTISPDDPFLITGMNFKDGEIRWDEVYHITEDRYNEAPEIQLKPDDLLITKDGTIGKLLYINDIPHPHKASLNSHLLVLRPLNKAYHTRFLYYQLQSQWFDHHVELTKTGTTFFGISQDAMSQFKILLPELFEQIQIANYLDTKTAEIDNIIAAKKKLIQLYEEEKAAIINQAVTKGINPDVTLKPSGVEWLGDIPEHWNSAPMKYLGSFINGYSFKSSDFQNQGVRVLKISNIQHMHIDWSDESFVEEKLYEEFPNFQVYQNDLVFALTRPIISSGIKVAMIDTDEKILINQRNSIFRTEEIDPKWLYYILLNKKFIQEFDMRIDKTGQQPNISSNDIGEIKIPITTKEETKFIVEYLEASIERMNKKIERAKKLIELLTEYRTTLISEVVTGKVKVTT